MSPLVQQLVAYTLVVLAGAYLLRRWLRRRRERACDRCGPGLAANTPPGRGVRPRSLRVLR